MILFFDFPYFLFLLRFFSPLFLLFLSFIPFDFFYFPFNYSPLTYFFFPSPVFSLSPTFFLLSSYYSSPHLFQFIFSTLHSIILLSPIHIAFIPPHLHPITSYASLSLSLSLSLSSPTVHVIQMDSCRFIIFFRLRFPPSFNVRDLIQLIICSHVGVLKLKLNELA